MVLNVKGLIGQIPESMKSFEVHIIIFVIKRCHLKCLDKMNGYSEIVQLCCFEYGFKFLFIVAIIVVFWLFVIQAARICLVRCISRAI